MDSPQQQPRRDHSLQGQSQLDSHPRVGAVRRAGG